MELSIVLKKIRENRNLTIQELAKITGLGKGTIGDIETGRSKSTVKTLHKIAKALELNIEEKNLLFSTFLGNEITISPGKILKKVRKKNNITGEELAEILNCSTQFIYSIESDKSKFPLKKLEIIKNIIDEKDYLELLEAIKLDNESPILRKEKLKIKFSEQIQQNRIPFFSDVKFLIGYKEENKNKIGLEFIEVPKELNKSGNIAIKVFEESMEPEIKEEDIIIIETKHIKDIKNKIIVVDYQGAVYLKKYVEEENDSYLVSINPYYPRIKVLDKTEFRVIGKLKGVMRYY